MLKIYITFLCLCISVLLIGQSQSDLTGEVKGIDDESLMSATVVILAQSDSTLVSFALTNGDGRFAIDDVDYGDYLIQVTFLGYEQYSTEIKVGADSNSDIGIIQLVQSSTALEQVEIKGEHVPMVVKKDTLEYNAAAFQTQPNEVVEDLLRKLPGVEVDNDGTITCLLYTSPSPRD